MTEFTIRALRRPEEMDAAVELQTIYWGSDMGALVPAHMLLSLASYGGHVLGAFAEERMVGMLLGFMGTDLAPETEAPAAEHLLTMSKRMVVLPEYRGKKIGEALKLEQRRIALRQRVPLVTWTFDPLLSRNAYLNLHKLAATGQHYMRNYFGDSTRYSMLSQDRIVVNWWVNHPATCARLDAGETIRLPKDRLQRLNAAHEHNDLPQPPQKVQGWDAQVLYIEIPAQFDQIEQRDKSLAAHWRDYVREVFTALFEQSYYAIDFVREGARSYYVFAHSASGLGAIGPWDSPG